MRFSARAAVQRRAPSFPGRQRLPPAVAARKRAIDQPSLGYLQKAGKDSVVQRERPLKPVVDIDYVIRASLNE
jgi:hypothetical protein